MKNICGACALALLLAMVGCDEDEITNTPIEETLETEIVRSLPTLVPLVGFMKTVSGRLTIFPVFGTTGLDCPDTADWCTSGNAVCYLDSVDGLDRIFTFDECMVAGADRPLTLDGNVSAIPSTLGPGLLGEITIANLVINGSPVVSGTGRTHTQTCYYEAYVQAGGTQLQAGVVVCDADTYPTDGTLHILLSSYQISIQFDGTSTPSALARRNSTGESVAECAIDLVALTSSCIRITGS